MPSTRSSRLFRRLAPILAALPLLTLTADPPGARAAGAPGFVQRDGTRLVLDEETYVFTGLDIYNAATSDGTCWYPMARDDVLDASLTDIGSGKEAFRAWFFQTAATT